jgi:hypothetical protein
MKKRIRKSGYQWGVYQKTRPSDTDRSNNAGRNKKMKIGTSGVGADPCVCPHNRANTQVCSYPQVSRRQARFYLQAKNKGVK